MNLFNPKTPPVVILETRAGGSNELFQCVSADRARAWLKSRGLRYVQRKMNTRDYHKPLAFPADKFTREEMATDEDN